MTLLPLSTVLDTAYAGGGGRLVAEANQNPLALTVKVDWTGTGTYVDESSRVRSLSRRRGRAQVTDQFAAGQCVIRLKNADGRFAPYNTSSPLYPNVGAARAMTATATYHGMTYPVFAGYVSEVAQTTNLPNAEVQLTCLDAFDRFRVAITHPPVIQNTSVDAMIGGILDTYGWPAGARKLDAGRFIKNYVAPHGNALAQLQHAAQQEIWGLLYIDRAGNVVFENTAHRAQTPVTAHLTSVEGMQLGLRQTDLMDSVAATYGVYWIPNPTAQLYSGQNARPLAPAPNTTYFSDYWTVPAALGSLTPVATTDYLVNSQPDGSGFDETPGISVASWTADSVGFTVGLTSTVSTTTYVTQFNVRGVQLAAQGNGPTITVPALHPAGSGQLLSRSFDAVLDAAAVNEWAMNRAQVMQFGHPRPVITLVGKTADLAHLILGSDLSTRLIVQDQDHSAPWLSGILGQFFVEGETLDLTPGRIPTATWTLFDKAQGAWP